jgi:hypothetical protein
MNKTIHFFSSRKVERCKEQEYGFEIETKFMQPKNKFTC